MPISSTPGAWILRNLASIAFGLILLAAVTPFVQSQTLTTIYSFTGNPDGINPYGVIIDRAGNLYGTAIQGGGGGEACRQFNGCGTVYKLSYRGIWIFSLLYSFTGGSDGLDPLELAFGPDGSLYGSTDFGGAGLCLERLGCGIIYRLRPPATICRSNSCPWSETVLHRFGGTDGFEPGPLFFNGAGNIFGTTRLGGILGQGCGGYGCGVAFQLVHSGGNWSENILYQFTGADDGAEPAGMTLDSAGRLYGVTSFAGAYQCGTAFALTNSGEGWSINTLYAFNPHIGDGCEPSARPIFDHAGNLYGANIGYNLDGGAVFQLVPEQGGWTENVLHSFPGDVQSANSPLIMDSEGNLYGTTITAGAHNCGSIYKLSQSNGGWIYTSLYDFQGVEGCAPAGPIAMDSQRNLYGTTYAGGSYNAGTVWKLAP